MFKINNKKERDGRPVHLLKLYQNGESDPYRYYIFALSDNNISQITDSEEIPYNINDPTPSMPKVLETPLKKPTLRSILSDNIDTLEPQQVHYKIAKIQKIMTAQEYQEMWNDYLQCYDNNIMTADSTKYKAQYEDINNSTLFNNARISIEIGFLKYLKEKKTKEWQNLYDTPYGTCSHPLVECGNDINNIRT